MTNTLPFAPDMLEIARRNGSGLCVRVMVSGPDGAPAVICHASGSDPDCARAQGARLARYFGGWTEEQAVEVRAAERVDLQDGPELQGLIPGVDPVPEAARQIARETARRAARRGAAALPAGGLWDETAQRQQELF